jgi:hypothetical protein
MNPRLIADSLNRSPITRRAWFERMAGGLYGAALAHLFGSEFGNALANSALEAATAKPPGMPPVYDLKARPPHFPTKAKAVIQLFMNGGHSQMELFDPPMLDRHTVNPISRKSPERSKT